MLHVDAPRSACHAAASLTLGDHACAIYEHHEELVELAVHYMASGAQRGLQCIHISDETTPDEMRAALAAHGLDVAALEASGQLRIVTKHETYLRDGEFHPEAMLEFLTDVANASVDQFGGTCGMGEMSWSASASDGFARLIEYERRLNQRLPGLPISGFCAYRRDLYPAHVLIEVLRAHPIVIYGGRAYQNFFYVPPEEHATGRPETELRRLLENLEARQRLEDERVQAAERARELARLREAEAIKDELIGAAAHELRNPLTPLRVQLDLLRKTASPKQQPTLDVMQRSIDRMADLLGDFMGAMRLHPGADLGEVRDVHIGRLVQDVLDELGPLAQQKGIRVTATVEPVRVQVDERRILQAAFNLVSNSVKYTPEGGRITVSARPARAGALIQVEDTGVGWEPAQTDRLFGSFVRLPNSQHLPGTGMGLYVAKRIAQQHGGTLTAHSSGKGRGSRFELWLPRTPMAGPTIEPLIQAAP